MSDVYLGQIIPFGFQFAPSGFQYCNGQLLPIQQNAALYSLLGTYYGGNGSSTFALPNLQGRAAIGQGQSAGTNSYVIGQSAGTETATLNITNLPAHNHTGSQAAYSGKANAQTPTAGAIFAKSVDTGGTAVPNIYVPSGTAGDVQLGGLTINPTGQNAPFSIRDPYLAINYCIATQGVYPSRN